MDSPEDMPPPTEDVDPLLQAQDLAKSGDLAGAEAMLAQLKLESGARRSGVHILHVRVLLKQGRRDDALEAARGSVRDLPFNWQVRALLAQTLLQLRRAPEAVDFLEDARRRFPDNTTFPALLAETLLVLGDPENALVSIESALASEIGSERANAVKIVILDAVGRGAEAQSLLAANPGAADKLPALYRDAIAGAATRRGKAHAIALAKSACATLPGDVPLHLNYVERLLAELQAQHAREVLDRLSLSDDAPEELRVRYRKAKARALQILHDREGAIDAFKSVLSLRPHDQDTLRSLYVLHQQAGKTAEMRDYGARLTASGAKTMPETLLAGLERIRTDPPATKIEPSKVAWAWEISSEQPASREDWLSRLEWGHNADKLLKAWWLNLADRSAEIDALIDPPAAGALRALADDARCVCITTHLGPMAAGVRFLQTCGRPYRGFGYAGPDPVVGDAPPMRIAAKGNTGLKELIQEIRKGTLIGFAPDSGTSTEGLSLDFCGRRITLSTMVPRLIHKEQTASFWWQPLWRRGRIVVELERLPHPEAEEDVELWCRRWTAAYLAHVERIIRGAPENLNCAAGIWQNAMDGGAIRSAALASEEL
jgi:tetratricopeptide (TPR) repeat protein